MCHPLTVADDKLRDVLWRECVVLAIKQQWNGAVELDIQINAAPANAQVLTVGTKAVALAYPQLVGMPKVGDTVRVEASALAKGLGTGGYAMVTGIVDQLPPDPQLCPGHLVKARYMPIQPMVLGLDEQESVHHNIISAATSIFAMPVVAAELHSALPAVIAGIRSVNEKLKVVYVMLDGGALPAWFSRSLSILREHNWVQATITTGQAMGGDGEAVSVHSGLLAAKHVFNADIAVLCQGPGNLGTATKWGFSGLAVGPALDAAATLDGQPIAAMRMSNADQRERHRGISHHSETILTAVTHARVTVPIAKINGNSELEISLRQNHTDLLEQIKAEATAKFGVSHQIVEVPTEKLVDKLINCPVKLSTMGRDLYTDPLAFLAAAVGGAYAAQAACPPAQQSH